MKKLTIIALFIYAPAALASIKQGPPISPACPSRPDQTDVDIHGKLPVCAIFDKEKHDSGRETCLLESLIKPAAHAEPSSFHLQSFLSGRSQGYSANASSGMDSLEMTVDLCLYLTQFTRIPYLHNRQNTGLSVFYVVPCNGKTCIVLTGSTLMQAVKTG
jgi:hypothetical protein